MSARIVWMGMLAAMMMGGSVAVAQEVDPLRVPDIVGKGMQAYATKGALEALKVWFGLENVPAEQADQQGQIFQQIEQRYGAYLSFSMIGVLDVTRSTKIVYLSMDFERGPAFFAFQCYRSADGWKVVALDYNLLARQIVPFDLLKK